MLKLRFSLVGQTSLTIVAVYHVQPHEPFTVFFFTSEVIQSGQFVNDSKY